MIAMKDSVSLLDTITSCFSRGKFDEGDRLFREHQDAFSESIKLECMGNRHFYKRELQESIRCFEAAIMLAPTRVVPRYQYLVGVQEEREGNVVEAFKRYQAAIDAEPTFPDPYVELGGLLVKVEDFEGAAQCYRDAINMEPNQVENHLNLKTVLTRLSLTDPDRYKAELEAVESAYEAVSQSGLSQARSTHRW
jgi:tetratricopeptide (TPR) repeat protein